MVYGRRSKIELDKRMADTKVAFGIATLRDMLAKLGRELSGIETHKDIKGVN
jgi:hypothetical protein